MRKPNPYRSLTNVAEIEAVLEKEYKKAEINHLEVYKGLDRESAEVAYALGHRVFESQG